MKKATTRRQRRKPQGSNDTGTRAERWRRHYTLAQLLVGETPEWQRALVEETAWARDGAPVGREL